MFKIIERCIVRLLYCIGYVNMLEQRLEYRF